MMFPSIRSLSRKAKITATAVTACVLGLVLVITIVSASSETPVKLIPNRIYPDWETAESKIKHVDRIDKVKNEPEIERSLRLKKMEFSVNDITESTFYLDGATLVTDLYKPVKFMMKEHALRENSNCALCHHKTPNRTPVDEKDARLMETTKCESCHQGTSPYMEPEDRLSLKAAYHARCIECHKESGNDKAPVYCTGCHRRNIPSHEKLFTVEGDPKKITPAQMTGLCLECHPTAGEEMIKSAHYKWGGPISKWTVIESDAKVTGKNINALNNNCISPYGDWGHCTKCHTGYGLKKEDGEFDKHQENIDCLVCHAEEDTYGKGKDGMPEDDVDLVWAAGLVGATSRASCGACHFNAGGGNARKGTLYNALNHPVEKLDVHMGGEFNMICADCHKGRQHRIPGRHSSIGVDEGIVECTDCHSATPHAGNELAKHMDRHVDHIACATCHIPTFARAQLTRYYWDWRDVGKKGDKEVDDENGKPVYLPDEGTFKWEKGIKPVYDWDNGYTKRYLMGDKIDDMNKPVIIGRNLGDYNDTDSKIGPFKIFRGWQPADAEYKYLVIPKLTGEEGVWESKKWDEAVTLGMKDAGLPFSGKITFVETELRFRPRHEVAPKDNALTCVQCHSEALADENAAKKTCARCHNEARPKEIKNMLAKGKGRKDEYLPWKDLGYEKDPIHTGGRFSK